MRGKTPKHASAQKKRQPFGFAWDKQVTALHMEDGHRAIQSLEGCGTDGGRCLDRRGCRRPLVWL